MRCLIVKYSGLKFLTIVAFVMLVCVIAAAEEGNKDAEQKKVLTDIEQRMLRTICIDVNDVPIDMVIRQLAEQADVDLIKSPKVTGNVTATLSDVPLEEALSNILAVHGCTYVPTKNMIRIVPIGEVTEKTEMLISRIYQITYADVAQVEEALKKFVSKRGALSSNQGTSHIIVTDTENNIKAIDTFIREVDRITPQVLVEVRIYDITSRDRLDLGIEWVAGRNTTFESGPIGTNPTAGRSDPFITTGFSAPTSKTATTTLGFLRFGLLNESIDVDMQLRAEQENIDAKLLANPRILVLDNETALFDIVTEHPYIERTITGTSITETVKFKNVGVSLQVTPHVARDGMLRLQILPKFGVVVQKASAETSNVPVVDTRTVNTIALVKDGQTVVLGGLRKKDVSKQINKVPFLGDLPLLGGLFRFQGEDTAITELVVFITPQIIEQQPIMSETEQQQFEATEFKGPKAASTKAETALEE